MAVDTYWEKMLSSSFWKEMNDIYTMMPAVVVSVVDDFKEQRINVQPSLNKLFQGGDSSPRPTILNVPVIMPATSTSAITMPIDAGDTVWLMFSMRAMEMFMEGDGRPSTPNNHAKYDQKDCVALIGLFPRKNAINNPNKRTHPHSTKDLVVAHNIGEPSEVEIRLKSDGKVIINCHNAEVNAQDSVSIKTPELNIDATTTNWTGNIVHTGNTTQTGSITASGDVSSGGVSVTSHEHKVIGVQTGGATITSEAPN